ncbi:MAG TPA: hypothetical protein VE631_04880, partial [Alphaproteobacteria bacterium]|nr:hypothetical protein [Alphaproteobacteria bacterium]
MSQAPSLDGMQAELSELLSAFEQAGGNPGLHALSAALTLSERAGNAAAAPEAQSLRRIADCCAEITRHLANTAARA